MARHRDISKAHARLEGEGWHIEYHREAVVTSSSRKPKKKHTKKERVNFYGKNKVNELQGKCRKQRIIFICS